MIRIREGVAERVVICPCCKGQKRLTVVEHDDGRTVLTRPLCCHCQGTGKVPAEVED